MIYTADIRRWALDKPIMELRDALGGFTAAVFHEVGENLHVSGHIVGEDRKRGASPFGHGDDETVAISLLLRISSELIAASADLFRCGHSYAGAALVRQLVEVEYLAWAFETRDEDAKKWLRSTKDERQSFFRPAKLRKASKGRFRGVDYGYHCEMGGHPVPRSGALLADNAMGQLMLSDALGHTGRIWDHVERWSRGNPCGVLVRARADEMLAQYTDWKERDLLTRLPPPPENL